MRFSSSYVIVKEYQKLLKRLMNSQELAQYIEATNGISKPWLLVQLRLTKLQERKQQISPQEYMSELEDIQADLLKLGEWWQGREDEVFGS
jgi:hypothetical protein